MLPGILNTCVHTHVLNKWDVGVESICVGVNFASTTLSLILHTEST